MSSPVAAVMQENFGCAVANRFYQLLDDESDPFDILREAERRQQQRKKRDEAATADRRAGAGGRAGGSVKESQKERKQPGSQPAPGGPPQPGTPAASPQRAERRGRRPVLPRSAGSRRVVPARAARARPLTPRCLLTAVLWRAAGCGEQGGSRAEEPRLVAFCESTPGSPLGDRSDECFATYCGWPCAGPRRACGTLLALGRLPKGSGAEGVRVRTSGIVPGDGWRARTLMLQHL